MFSPHIVSVCPMFRIYSNILFFTQYQKIYVQYVCNMNGGKVAPLLGENRAFSVLPVGSSFGVNPQKQHMHMHIVRITGEVAVSALSSPYLSMLRDCKCLVRCQVSDCKCLVRCQVSVCLSQFPWFRKRWHTRVGRNSGSPRQIKQAAR